MNMNNNYDFCGWATRNDLRCSDGRIIRRNAFKHNDGDKVPLIWNHDHSSPSKLVGHCILENRDEGVYTYGYLNNSKSAQEAREGLLHGDIDSLSIYANHLQQNGSEVLHGSIKEVSLVLAGANPGARIENVIEHMDGCEEEAIITTGDFIELYHADEPKKDEKKEEAKEPEPAKEPEEKEPEKKDDSEETVKDVIDSMTDKQKTVMYAVVGAALDAAGGKKDASDEDDDDKDEGDEKDMKHNLFEGQENQEMNDVLSHSDIEAIFADAKESGSLRNAVIRHGITGITNLYTEDKPVEPIPGMIKRPDEWVSIVMNGVHRTPFSRVKSMWANITGEDARAKGYVKGHQKVDEVLAALKRFTPATMVYKKQSIDRQDLLEITDFNFVAWLKEEMKGMLNEEIARALLVGDGRANTSDDKIPETNIRPIWTDDDVFTVHKVVSVAANADEDTVAKAIIRGAIKARKDYTGSGNPTAFIGEDYLSDMLLMEDKMGRPLYDTEEKLRTALRVSRIVSVPVMDGLTRTVDGTTRKLACIIVNLNDYNLGFDNGGEATMFDDFDIDYNAQKYLIEAYCSGAMIRPHGAIALEVVVGE